MKLLLDTQIVIWWFINSPKLKASVAERIEKNSCLLSTASIWEVAIKYRLGKIAISPARFRDEFLNAGGQLLGINDKHVIQTAELPDIHQDPFDRLIIAQATLEGLSVLTADRAWSKYDIPVIQV